MLATACPRGQPIADRLFTVRGTVTERDASPGSHRVP